MISFDPNHLTEFEGREGKSALPAFSDLFTCLAFSVRLKVLRGCMFCNASHVSYSCQLSTVSTCVCVIMLFFKYSGLRGQVF